MFEQAHTRRAWCLGLMGLGLSPHLLAQTCPALLQQRYLRLQDEAPQSLCQYQGKVLLVVNTASYCGFTQQYEGLEQLHSRLSSKGLVVLGFPSNNFGRQEPGTNDQIAAFCQNTFGVKFPMAAKNDVVGPQAHPLYKQLAKLTGEVPRWNFHKYLINRSATQVKSYPSEVAPNQAAFLRDIDAFIQSAT